VVRTQRLAAVSGRQQPSDDPEFARLLVAAGIDSISVAPDSFFMVKQNIAEAEAALAAEEVSMR